MSFAERLLAWYDDHGRKDLPWQGGNAYRVWLSEIMLQQTQVATVIGYYDRFLTAFPTLADLAAASEDEVLAQWSGLGYYSRARNIRHAARACVELHGGDLPRDFEALLGLPGIGRSTAGAILAQVHGDPFPILDGNVKRVLARHAAIEGWPGRTAVQRALWELAETRTPSARVADYTQAIMDLGATVCRPREPACDCCPVSSDCTGRATGEPLRYPAKRPRKALPEKHRFALLVVHDETVVLERRPPTGIWGGLYAPPLVEELDIVGSAHPMAAPIRHTFTHFRLVMTPVRLETWPARLEDLDRRSISRSDLSSVGLPRPVAGLLQDHFQGTLQWQERFIA
ncbi:MAG: A/G-specific adenine glycosylase [Pseudomonadota bacterium]